MWEASCTLALACAVAGAAHAQTLSESVAAALANSDAIASDRAEVDALKERRVQVASQRRATVQAEATAGLAQDSARVRLPGGRDDFLTSTRQPGTVGVTASQPIYTGGRLSTALREADLRVIQGRAQLRSGEVQVARNALVAHADLVRDARLAEVLEESALTLAEDLRAARARFEAGDVSITDVAQAEARLAGVQGQAATARGRLQASRANYERVVGQPASNPSTDMTPPPIPPTLDEAVMQAVAGNPDLIAARLAEDISTAAARAADSQRNPVVIMQGSVRADTDSDFDGSRGINSSVQARLTMPLWSGGSTPSRVRENLARATAARLNARDLEREVTSRVIQAWSEINAARENVRSAEIQVTAAELARRGAEAEKRFGLRSTIEALNQEQELRQARVALASAKRDLVVFSANLLLVIGDDPLDVLRPLQAGDALLPESALPERDPVSDWEEPLVRAQQWLERRDKPFLRALGTARSVFGPEE